jgi:hypothetical protein
MYDPVSMKYVPLGKHHKAEQDKVVGELKARMEQERHEVQFSELPGPR